MPYHTLNLDGLHKYITQRKILVPHEITYLKHKTIFLDLKFPTNKTFLDFFQIADINDCITLTRKLDNLLEFIQNVVESDKIVVYLSEILAFDVFLFNTLQKICEKNVIECYTITNDEEREAHLLAYARYYYDSATKENDSVIISPNNNFYIYSSINFIPFFGGADLGFRQIEELVSYKRKAINSNGISRNNNDPQSKSLDAPAVNYYDSLFTEDDIEEIQINVFDQNQFQNICQVPPILIPVFMAEPEIFGVNPGKNSSSEFDGKDIEKYEMSIISSLKNFKNRKREDFERFISKIRETWRNKFEVNFMAENNAILKLQAEKEVEKRNQQFQVVGDSTKKRHSEKILCNKMAKSGLTDKKKKKITKKYDSDDDYDVADNYCDFSDEDYDDDSSETESDTSDSYCSSSDSEICPAVSQNKQLQLKKELDSIMREKNKKIKDILEKYIYNENNLKMHNNFHSQAQINNLLVNGFRNLTMQGFMNSIGTTFFENGNRKLPRVDGDNFCYKNPWEISTKLRQVYYALYHRGLSAYDIAKDKEKNPDANQVNEMDWFGGGHLNVDRHFIEYDFKTGKSKLIEKQMNYAVKKMERETFNEQFFGDFAVKKNVRDQGFYTNLALAKNNGAKNSTRASVKRLNFQQTHLEITGYKYKAIHCHSLGSQKDWWTKSIKSNMNYLVLELLRIKPIRDFSLIKLNEEKTKDKNITEKQNQKNNQYKSKKEREIDDREDDRRFRKIASNYTNNLFDVFLCYFFENCSSPEKYRHILVDSFVWLKLITSYDQHRLDWTTNYDADRGQNINGYTNGLCKIKKQNENFILDFLNVDQHFSQAYSEFLACLQDFEMLKQSMFFGPDEFYHFEHFETSLFRKILSCRIAVMTRGRSERISMEKKLKELDGQLKLVAKKGAKSKIDELEKRITDLKIDLKNYEDELFESSFANLQRKANELNTARKNSVKSTARSETTDKFEVFEMFYADYNDIEVSDVKNTDRSAYFHRSFNKLYPECLKNYRGD